MSEEKKATGEEKLQNARQKWEELHNLPSWIEDDYSWGITLQGVNYTVIYIDSDTNYIELNNVRTSRQSEYTEESEVWNELLEQLATTTPTKDW